MKKSILIVAGCFISVILFQAFTTTTDPRFTNLKILPKDISEHDLDSVMHHFDAALGVKCNFCHVIDTVAKKLVAASDDKPEKNIARQMMLMSIDINKNYFKAMNDHDMDHDHDMNKNMSHDSSMMKDHDMDKNKEHHGMDTGMIMEPSKYMLASVTCFTCHRGDPHPVSKAPQHQEGPPPPPKTGDKK